MRGDEDTGVYHLVWTRDMTNSALGVEYTDVEADGNQTIRFTFFRTESESREGRDFEIAVEQKYDS